MFMFFLTNISMLQSSLFPLSPCSNFIIIFLTLVLFILPCLEFTELLGSPSQCYSSHLGKSQPLFLQIFFQNNFFFLFSSWNSYYSYGRTFYIFRPEARVRFSPVFFSLPSHRLNNFYYLSLQTDWAKHRYDTFGGLVADVGGQLETPLELSQTAPTGGLSM